ncbi:hypothetical protein C8J57DRAFT_123428 [Mycena rebaudengoi]|nr:hypothetical protein C8J57DRAFT_123428 [Mycena rebaudengoi]
MDRLASVTAALNAGKLPTTEQLNALIDWLTKSIVPAIQPSEDGLSGQGRVLSDDIRKILDAYKSLNSNKNNDNLLQEAISHLTEGDLTVISDPNEVVDKKEVSSDVTAVRSSIRTLLSILWSSIASEGSFLLNDFASFSRLALADAAEVVESGAARAKESLLEVEQGVQDGKRDNLGRDKERLEEEKDLRVAFEHGMDTVKDAGSSLIGAGQTAKAKAEETSDRTTARLEAAYQKACTRAQKDPKYRDAISTLFDTVHKWVSKALDTAADKNLSLDDFIDDPTPEQHIRQALGLIKTLTDRFAKPRSSVDDVQSKAQKFIDAARKDTAEVKSWVDKFFDHIRRSLDEPDYPRSDEAKAVRRDLRKRARVLLDADTEAGRTWAELKETLQVFGLAVAEDKDLQRVREAHVHLGNDIERGLVQAGQEAETGVQAVLERASWFWQDLFAVYGPRALALLKDIPIPRTEYVDAESELVLENLDISSFKLNPAHVFIRNITDIDVQTSETAAATTGVGTFTHVRLQAVQLQLNDVSFYYNDKTSTLPPSEFTGLLGLTLPPKGIDIDIKFRLITDPEQRILKRAFHIIEMLEVEISDDIELSVRESNHAVVLALFKPIFNMRFRQALGRSLEEQLRAGLAWVDSVAWDVGRRAEVFTDTGLGRGASLAAAVWSELGRLSRLSSAELRMTGTGVVLQDWVDGGVKLAMGAEPQVLSGDKRGPVGTGSESLEKRVGEAVNQIKAQTGSPEDVKGAVKEEALNVKAHVEGLVDEGKKQVRTFQRSVEAKTETEKKNKGWKSQAFDL